MNVNKRSLQKSIKRRQLNGYVLYKIIDCKGTADIYEAAREIAIVHEDLFVVNAAGEEHTYVLDFVSEISIQTKTN